METRSLMDELRSFEKGCFFDLGHPLLNRIAESFVKAAGIGAVQAVSREAYFTTIEGAGLDSSTGGLDISGSRKQRLPDLKGESNRKSLEAMVKNTGKESFQWGLAAGMYSGLTYGLKEARGAHDWVIFLLLISFPTLQMACIIWIVTETWTWFGAEEQCSRGCNYGGCIGTHIGGCLARADCAMRYHRSSHFYSRKSSDGNILRESNRKSLEAMFLVAGLAAGMYSGLTYGLKEARGAHDWFGAEEQCSRGCNYGGCIGTHIGGCLARADCAMRYHRSSHFYSRKSSDGNILRESNRKSLEAMFLVAGLAAGMYSGLTYGLKEARGAHDWVIFLLLISFPTLQMACIIWIVTETWTWFGAEEQCSRGCNYGAALALTSEDASHEQIVQCAITGAAISTAANLLTGIF
ncbi:hypothetical protein HHK36_023006 [Tetracentron sinense]|uniref:Uncharacterized protein n=1 Tax=Tetracentron sinense TaxID=13715 RepID=A0A835D9D9_TETSI|nr:hypothetical protein HHK36_023006 [Tetracentron sinense]